MNQAGPERAWHYAEMTQYHIKLADNPFACYFPLGNAKFCWRLPSKFPFLGTSEFFGKLPSGIVPGLLFVLLAVAEKHWLRQCRDGADTGCVTADDVLQ